MQENTEFEILNRVDVGGMAEIFRAKNIKTGEIIAIKRILPALSAQDEFVKMFVDEATVCLNLHHPNIVRVRQIGLLGEALFLSMEYVAGANLRDVLKFASQYSFHLPVHEAVRIAICVLDGLDYAHDAKNDQGAPLNLIHRDVSPPNILLGYNGDVKLTDFGLVKSKIQMTRTMPGLIKGKFSYLSPEAAYGESIDRRSDIYAVGIILWEMLTSQPLFNDPVDMKILDLVRKSIIPPISPLNPDVSADLESIIMKGLARNRADRYPTAGAFADALREFLHSIGDPPSELGKIVSAIKPPSDNTSAENLSHEQSESAASSDNSPLHAHDSDPQPASGTDASRQSESKAPKSDSHTPAKQRSDETLPRHMADTALKTDPSAQSSKLKLILIVLAVILTVLAAVCAVIFTK